MSTNPINRHDGCTDDCLTHSKAGENAASLSTVVTSVSDTRIRDEKNRLTIAEMSDRELLEESIIIGRAIQDLVEDAVAKFTGGKMGGAMGMFAAMMGGGK